MLTRVKIIVNTRVKILQMSPEEFFKNFMVHGFYWAMEFTELTFWFAQNPKKSYNSENKANDAPYDR